jgi:histidyl-tRNA synthetase
MNINCIKKSFLRVFGMVQRIKGTQDFLDMTLFDFFINRTVQHLTTYHFSHIATPILEPTELFKRSLGLHTDVVTKEMYTVNTEGDSICLRPEATAPIMRAFIENAGILTTPWKVFTYGPMFRHERPQKGRFRQFHQVSIEVIDSASIDQDALMITMLDRLFREIFKLNNFAILLNFLGCAQDRVAFKKILEDYLATVSDKICPQCTERKTKNILRIFDCKTESCQVIYRTAPHPADHICADCTIEWHSLQQHLNLLGVSFAYAPTLVRGLDYYTKTVFEFVSNNLGAQNAFCGGGRYDMLSELLDGPADKPSIGAAIGIERALLLLEANKDVLALPQPPALHVVIPLSKEQHTLALLVADELLANSLCTEVLLDGSVKSMMRKANKMGARYCLILGSEEQEQKMVMVKNMLNGTEEKMRQTEVVSFLKK